MTITAPLAWNGRGHQTDAQTPFGSYSVSSRNGKFQWRYCFVEYFDEHEASCVDEEDGRRLAQADWDRRMKPILATLVISKD